MRFAGRKGRKAECGKGCVWECNDQSGAVADPPRSVWATGSWSCKSHIDAAFDQLCKPRPTTFPLFPGDGAQPPPSPLFQGAQHRRSFAETEVSDHLSNRMFGWDRYQNVNMIRHQVPFLNLAFLAPGRFAEYSSKVPPDMSKQSLLAVLWRKDDMVLSLPCRVIQMAVTL
jgi:hypothetical protein